VEVDHYQFLERRGVAKAQGWTKMLNHEQPKAEGQHCGLMALCLWIRC
jgi:hypothetical protein